MATFTERHRMWIARHTRQGVDDRWASHTASSSLRDWLGLKLGLTKGRKKSESVRRCVESKANLTVADRSGALFLLAHNPKVAGSNPAPATKFSPLGSWF